MSQHIIERYEVRDGKIEKIKTTVYSIRANGAVPIQIVHYHIGPPILDQCPACEHYREQIFSPPNCDKREAVTSKIPDCVLAENLWQDALCTNFIQKSMRIKLPIVAMDY